MRPRVVPWLDTSCVRGIAGLELRTRPGLHVPNDLQPHLRPVDAVRAHPTRETMVAATILRTPPTLTSLSFARTLPAHAAAQPPLHPQGPAGGILPSLRHRGHPTRIRRGGDRRAASPARGRTCRDRRVRGIALPALGVQVGVRPD